MYLGKAHQMPLYAHACYYKWPVMVVISDEECPLEVYILDIFLPDIYEGQIMYPDFYNLDTRHFQILSNDRVITKQTMLNDCAYSNLSVQAYIPSRKSRQPLDS